MHYVLPSGKGKRDRGKEREGPSLREGREGEAGEKASGKKIGVNNMGAPPEIRRGRL